MDYQEFPKWIYPADKDPVLVQSAEEEAALTETEKTPTRRGRPPKVTEVEKRRQPVEVVPLKSQR